MATLNWVIFLLALAGLCMVLRDGIVDGLLGFGKVILGIAGAIGLFIGIFNDDWTLIGLLVAGTVVVVGGRFLYDAARFQRENRQSVPKPPPDTRWDEAKSIADDDDPWRRMQGH